MNNMGPLGCKKLLWFWGLDYFHYFDSAVDEREDIDLISTVFLFNG